MSSNSKTRPPRLRASCDGCFLAKVKCSKARPLCSRCLACGLECRYSPSSRAGKPKADASNGRNNASHADNKHQAFLPSPTSPYKLEPGWSSPLNIDVAMSRDPSMSSSMSALGMGESSDHSQNAYYSNGIPWTPPEYSGGAYSEMSMAAMNMSGHHSRSSSIDATFSAQMNAWVDSTANQENVYFNSPNSIPTPPSAASAYIPSPSLTASTHLDMRPRSADAHGGSSCVCFSACLQSLQALHSASSPNAAAFDMALSLNRKAVDNCATMLSCKRCINRSGNPTTAMLLATVIGKITSFYKNASNSHFEPISGNRETSHGSENITKGGTNARAGLSVSLGTYTLAGEEGRWLELEILARELRKLQEVYSQFCDVCTDLTDDPEVSKAMIGYLGQSLGSTIEDISHRKGSMSMA